MIGYSKTETDPVSREEYYSLGITSKSVVSFQIAVPSIIEKFPDASSTKCIHHFSQIHQNGGKLRQFDYGPVRNMELYNSTDPPLYPLENIRVPFFMYHGSEDSFIDTKVSPPHCLHT